MFPKKMESAIELARGELGRTGKGYSLAAVGIRSDGATVTSVNGWNTDVEPKHHAEGRLIRKLDSGSTIFVARIKKDGTVAMAKPCPACQILLRARRVHEVHFTIDEASWGTLNLSDGTEKIRIGV
jgi:cytidine deaminase